MAKQVTAQVKLQCPGGQATPAPPVGPALGAHGVNIGMFVKQFNDRTAALKGMMTPVVITVYSDRSFEFIIKSPPAAVLLKQADGGWALQPTQLDFGGGAAIAEGRFGGSEPAQGKFHFSKMPLSLVDVVVPDVGLGGTISGIVELGSAALNRRRPQGGPAT